MNSSTREPELVFALKRLAQDTVVPAANPQSEQELLTAFDATWEQRRRAPARLRRVLPAAAALLALAATIVLMIARSTARVPAPAIPIVVETDVRMPTAVTASIPAGLSRDSGVTRSATGPRRVRKRRPPLTAPSPSDFVAWPGATGLPTFESGYLMRVDMPVSIVLSLGLVPHVPQAAFVQTDVLVGQDRLPRAVRLVP